jgi:hypothetical protein
LSARRACSFPSAVLPDILSTSLQNNPPPAMQIYTYNMVSNILTSFSSFVCPWMSYIYMSTSMSQSIPLPYNFIA